MYKTCFESGCSVKSFIWNISSLYITFKLYMYSLKSSSNYHVDVPSNTKLCLSEEFEYYIEHGESMVKGY